MLGKRFSDADLFAKSVLKNAFGLHSHGGAKDGRLARESGGAVMQL